MFAVVMTFDDTPDGTDAGVTHVLEEVIPTLKDTPGLLGLWMVDRTKSRRLTVMAWDDEAHYEAGMAAIAARRAANPGDHWQVPTELERYDLFAEVQNP